ncbi:MAG: NAD(P)/FAD-dependent oxidoreductase [Abitibacteriaceae bacterium]|nr:NAD(P)/FAD-dependent oxidoreductase [Abditibacteriaceae bacterium]
MKRVVIVGMGFGGIRAANGLGGKGLDVLVLDRQNFHLFQPLLYQVATAMLGQESIAHSIRSIIRHYKGVHFEMAEVQGIDLDKKQVITATASIPYDYLVIATGSVTNFFGNEEVKKHAFDLKQLDDAVTLRNHVLSVFERAVKEPDPKVREALMTFVIVGGGPTGTEFAGSLSELTHHVLTKDYPELPVQNSKIILLEASEHVLGPFPKKLQEYAKRRLQRMGVTVRLKTPVSGATFDRVFLKDGGEIPAYTLFWSAGVQAAPLSGVLPVPKGRGGRIVVQPDLSLKEHPEVFVIGDMAHLEQDGTPLPMLAPVAMQEGEYVAKAIVQREQGGQIKPFRYWDKGTMAVIGRSSAVANVGPLKLMGFFAWLAWLGLHLFYLIGFRNRVLTAIDWAFDYLFFDRQVRLITRERSEPADQESHVQNTEVPEQQQHVEAQVEGTGTARGHEIAQGRNAKEKVPA